MRVINDPLAQTQCPASSDHYSRLNVMCWEILKSVRTDGNMCENNDHCLPGLWVG